MSYVLYKWVQEDVRNNDSEAERNNILCYQKYAVLPVILAHKSMGYSTTPETTKRLSPSTQLVPKGRAVLQRVL